MSIRCNTDEGVTEFVIPAEEGCKPSLGNDAIIEVAKIAMEIESFYGVPQDAEWAYAKDERFILLQSRPLSSRGGIVELLKACTIFHVHEGFFKILLCTTFLGVFLRTLFRFICLSRNLWRLHLLIVKLYII